MEENLFDGTVSPALGNLQKLEMYNIGFNKVVSYGDNGIDFLT